VPVAYVPGLVMRRAADLYPGEAKTDRRDAYVIADTARTRRRQVHWLDVGSDELLARLGVLNGFDIDLAADQTRLMNRLRDALTSIFPVGAGCGGPRGEAPSIHADRNHPGQPCGIPGSRARPLGSPGLGRLPWPTCAPGSLHAEMLGFGEILFSELQALRSLHKYEHLSILTARRSTTYRRQKT
jgi:hypothetical protein